MKDIKELLEHYYKKIIHIFDSDNNSPKLLHKSNQLKNRENEELMTGMVVVVLIILIIISTSYYFLSFAPQQEQLDNLKQEKINRVNTLLDFDEENNGLAIISEIQSKNTIEDVENFDVDEMIYPILKNSLLEQLKEYKDKYNRVELCSGNTTDIMSIDNATNYINSKDADVLSAISIRPVDSVLVPLSINRKQAASGLITDGDVVDIYKSTKNALTDEENISTDVSSSSKIVGGSKVVSILRSKDSGSIEQNMELSEFPKSRNLSQASSLDIEEILLSKAAGTYDDSQLNILVDDYATRLFNYERTSHIGELDVEYIVMLEVPRDSVVDLIENMDNIILTIPTYDAPSWVKL